MSPHAPVPRAIRVDLPGNFLEIEWTDDRRTRHGGGWLRFHCPCASCRGHQPGEGDPPSREHCSGVRIVGAAPVGAYGIRFDFSDGHGTGIYAYDRLREPAPDSDW